MRHDRVRGWLGWAGLALGLLWLGSAQAQVSPYAQGYSVSVHPPLFVAGYAKDRQAQPAEARTYLDQLAGQFDAYLSLAKGADRVTVHYGLAQQFIWELRFPSPPAWAKGVDRAAAPVADKPGMFAVRTPDGLYVSDDKARLEKAARSPVKRPLTLPFPKDRMAVGVGHLTPKALPELVFGVDAAGGRLIINGVASAEARAKLVATLKAGADQLAKQGLTPTVQTHDGMVVLTLKGPGIAVLAAFSQVATTSVMKLERRAAEAP